MQVPRVLLFLSVVVVLLLTEHDSFLNHPVSKRYLRVVSVDPVSRALALSGIVEPNRLQRFHYCQLD